MTSRSLKSGANRRLEIPLGKPGRRKSGAVIKKRMVEYVDHPTRPGSAIYPNDDRPLGDVREEGSPPTPKTQYHIKGGNQKKGSSRIKRTPHWRDTNNASKYQET